MNRYEQMNREHGFTDAKKRVAAYCRVSTDHEDQANSFESQRRYFRELIENHPDWELFEIFADEGLSGTSTKKRKEFNRMIDCARRGCFDLILTKEISRFARNTLDSIYYTRELKRIGVGVVFMNDGINTLEGDAELRLAILSSIAQEESRKTSERVKWGQKRQMEQGVVFGRSMLGYDVKNGKMTVNEDGANTVRLIFHKYVDEGKGTHVIARELKEEGILPMRVREWSNTVILRILRNEKYCGDLIQKKTYTPDYLSHEKKYNRGQEEFIILKDHHPPIIPRELFQEANRILDAKAQSPAGKAKYSRRYPFSGKIRCGCCGAGFVSRCKTRKDGTRCQIWRCANAVKHGRLHQDPTGNWIGCSAPGIRGEEAEQLMLLVCRTLPYHREEIRESLIALIRSVLPGVGVSSGPSDLRERIEALRDKQAKLIDLFVSSAISKEEFLEAKSRYEREIATLESANTAPEGQIELSKREALILDVRHTVDDILSGRSYDETFCTRMLDRMVITGNDTIDVYLHQLPMPWRYRMVTPTSDAGGP